MLQISTAGSDHDHDRIGHCRDPLRGVASAGHHFDLEAGSRHAISCLHHHRSVFGHRVAGAPEVPDGAPTITVIQPEGLAHPPSLGTVLVSFRRVEDVVGRLPRHERDQPR